LVGRVVLSREESSSSPVMWGRPRPSLQGGGGPVDLVSSREAGEEVLGSESPALSPLPASSPFRSAPGPRHLVVGGRLRCFLPFWKAELELSTQLLRAVEDFHPPSTSRPPLRSRECAFRLPLKAPSSVSSIQRWQLCFELGAIEEVELHPPPLGFISYVFLVQKKVGWMRPVIVHWFVCSSFGYPSLQGGVPSGRASVRSSWGSGWTPSV
jgi:hypothetical protein